MSDRIPDDPLAVFERWYHIPALALVVLFMFWVRIQNLDTYLREDGVWLQAVDSWYHWRTTEWTVENYPFTLEFEAWTGFPDGTMLGQFGTFFDQIVATIALIIGLGTPTEADIHLAALITVPALAALVALPAFGIGRRLGGRGGGLAGIAVLALAPGIFLQRTTAGMLQHHVAEVLFMAAGVLGLMVAISVAERERPIWELVVNREWEALRATTIYSALAGVAITLYILSWPPGVVLIGIFGVFLVIQLALDFVAGRSPDHVAYAGVVSMVVVAVLTIPFIEEPGFSATSMDYLPTTMALLVGAGAIFMAWLARQWEQFEYDVRGYPVAIAGSIVVALGLLSVVMPGLYSELLGNLFGRVLPWGHSPSALTVAEVQPPEDFFGDHAFREFGLAFYTGLVGLVALIGRPFYGRKLRAEHLFVAVWTLFLISMAMTQARFGYYLILGVVATNAYLVGLAIEWVDLDAGLSAIDEVETYQILTIGVVIMLLLVPLMPPIAAMSAVEAGDRTAPSGDAMKWEDANDWVAENTPEVGNYAGAGNELDYMGDFDRPEDGSFDYPEGAYGILSWWDYGHLITVQGERIPHSNPFQQNARSSSAVLQAQSEEQAELYLDAIAAGESPRFHTDPDQRADHEAELEAAIEDAEDMEEIRYIMIDDETAGGKFPAVSQWTGPDYRADYTGLEEFDFNGESTMLESRTERFEETMVNRLYHEDATGLKHYRLVHETEQQSEFVSVALQEGGQWQTLIHDREVSPYASQQVQEIYNAAFQQPNVEFYQRDPVSSVKTFERVEGATITGDAEPGANVTAMLPVQTNVEAQEEQPRTFIYQQEVVADADGTFEITVPYPTDEELGPEDGYAEAAVTADEEYFVGVRDNGQMTMQAEDVAVPETAIQQGEEVPVDLEAVEPELPEDFDEDDLVVEEEPEAANDEAQALPENGD